MTVRSALQRFLGTRDPWAGSTDPLSAGNGSLMRLAPVPMFFARDPARAIAMAGDSSRTTHGAPEAVDACRYFAGLIVGALRGEIKESLLSEAFCPISGGWDELPLDPAVAEVAAGSFKAKEPPAIQGKGYVIASMEAALWAFHRAGDFREGALLAANLGDDADTTAAIYGQLAGAYYGVDGVPAAWREEIAMAATISGMADRLHDLSLGVADEDTAPRRRG